MVSDIGFNETCASANLLVIGVGRGNTSWGQGGLEISSGSAAAGTSVVLKKEGCEDKLLRKKGDVWGL